jgi:hypothetical protein
MGPAGPPLLFCPYQVQWKLAVGTCASDGYATATAHCPHGTFLMSSACAGYAKGSKPPDAPAVRVWVAARGSGCAPVAGRLCSAVLQPAHSVPHT